MKWMRGYIAGLLTALLVCGLAVTAGARTGKVTQELDYRDIRVSLDGKVLDLRNAIGEKVEPFMFGGTNYLPVRALAEALGLNVAWDGKEVMVVLTTPEPEPEPEFPTVTLVADPNGEPLKDPALEAETAPVTETPSGASNAGILDKYRVEIKRARLVRYWDGLAIVVTYEWTNNSDRAASALISLTESAFQNGTALAPAFPEDYNNHSRHEQVEPGASLEVETAFSLRNETDPVEVTLIDLMEKAETPVKMTFNPSEMEKPAQEEPPQAAEPEPVETPKAEEKPKTATPTQTVKGGPTVYITNTGKRYHYSSTCNGGHYFPVSLSEAIALGLTPCDKCT